MKKKTAITLLTAIITICCMIVFAACGSGCNDLGGEDYEIGSDSNGSGGVNDEIGGDTHEHTFSKQWSNDETYHWHAATCEHTGEVRDKAEHTFANGVCTVCSYRQPTAGLTYTLSYDGSKYSVSGIGTATEKNIFIPSEYNGIPVTGIGSYAFDGCTSITSVTIPSSVTSIGESAFNNCTSLTSIAIPSSVRMSGKDAFKGCTSLNDVYITDVAAWCDISFIDNDSNPFNYANNLYLNNELVTDLIIPSGVTSISDCALYNCTSITSVTIQSGVKIIGERAFENCTSITSVTIPDGVTSIGDSAFEDCTSLTEVNIPDGVTSIGDSAFRNCPSLTSINIPSSVTSIGNYAFHDCSALTIYCETDSRPNGWDKSWNNLYSAVVWSCKTNEVASDGNIYAVIDGVRYALRGGEATVAAQPINISAITIPTSVTYKNNTYNVTSIGDYAFKDCTLLTSITIPSSMTSIGLLTLSNCNSLKSLTVASGNAVYHSAGNCVIETASKALVAGCKNSVIPSDGSVTSISYSAFRDCEYLTSVTIPSSVTIIDDYAFAGCTYLKSVAILGDVTSISERAFSWCTYLESITIPSSVTIIGNSAFNGCAYLTSIYYEGTAEQWNEISIGSSNSLDDATCYYYSETNPFEGAGAVTEGNYWHYVDGIPTVWAK